MVPKRGYKVGFIMLTEALEKFPFSLAHPVFCGLNVYKILEFTNLCTCGGIYEPGAWPLLNSKAR